MASVDTGTASRLTLVTSVVDSDAEDIWWDVAWSLTFSERTSAPSTFNAGGVSASVAFSGIGTVWAGSFTFDWRPSGLQSVLIASGTTRVYGNPDGTGSVTATGTIGNTLTSGGGAGASIGESPTLPTLKVLPGTPTSVVATRVSDTSTTVSWSQSSASNGAPTSNTVQKRVNGGSWSTVTTVSATTSVSVATSADQKLEFRVLATNSAGSTDYSSPSAAIYTTPDAPTGVAAVKDASLNIDISWTPQVAYSEHEHVIEHSADGGAYAALATVASGTSTYEHATPNPAQTHKYRVRARATTGGLTSAWVESDTVQLLVAPNKPTLPDLPDYANKAADLVIPWTHNSVDTTTQTAYEFETSTTGGSSWSSSGKQTSTTQARTITGGTYAADVAVMVRVRTWGQASSGGSDGTGASAWSDPQTVVFKTAPVASITSPVDESTYTQAELVVTVGFTQAEGASFVQATAVLNDGAEDIETVVSGSQTIVFESPVENGGSYSVTVTVLDSNGVTSAPTSSDFDVAYTLPVAADVELVWLPETGWTQINLTIPEPGDGEEEAVTVSIFRTIDGVTETIVAAYPISETTFSIVDTTPTISGENAYVVRTFSGDGASASTADSLDAEETDWAYLSTGPGYADVVRFASNLVYTSSPSRATALVVASGRAKPIAMFGEQTSYVVLGSTMLADEGSTPLEVDRFLREPSLVCYRDPFPRRIFGTVSGSVSSPSSLWSDFTYQVVEAS